MKTTMTKTEAQARARKIMKSLWTVSDQWRDLQADLDYLKDEEIEIIDEIDIHSLILGMIRTINIINYYLTINYYHIVE